MKNNSLTFLLVLLLSISAYSQNFEQEFDNLLSKDYPASGTGAAALVAVGGKVIYKKAFGKANLELNVDMSVNSVFEIGSISKQFTAVSILMLAEQGKLNLDDEITKYIKNYPTHGHKITIHHLLSHTSGMGSFTASDEWYDNRNLDWTKERYFNLFKKLPMHSAPGEKYLYSNTGYVLLGAIIEEVSNKTYPEFINDHIFVPLGMKNSFYISKTRITPNLASGYDNPKDFIDKDFNENETVKGEIISLPKFDGGGSILSTVDDLFLWNRAIRNNKLISEESKTKAFTNYKLTNGQHTNYGYGWAINEVNGISCIEHNGGTMGFRSNGIYFPKEDVYVVILTNRTFSDPVYPSTKIAAIAVNKPFKEVDGNNINTDFEFLKKIIGTYEFEDGSSRIISIEDNKLYSQRPNREKIRLYQGEDNKFYFKNSFANLTFNLSPNKKPSAVYESRIYKSKGKKVK